jgi:4-amino-4-deoxy-L-arabinose transferase-like glycosyltransferase
MNVDHKKIFYYFIVFHIILWTAIPTIFNTNLPLDTIEALAWGNELKLGYPKYPPIFPLFTEFFFQIFGNQDWSYYLLSQLFVSSCFIIVFKFSQYFFNNDVYSLISVLLLETIYFFNYTTPELNAFIPLFPFLAATAFFCWKSLSFNNNFDWIMLGVFAGISTLTYYLSLYLLVSISFFFIIEMIINKKINYKIFLALFFYLLILTPHLYFIFESDFQSIEYAFSRSFYSKTQFLDHLFYPLSFLIKQILILVPLFILLYLLLSSFKINVDLRDKKLIFLFTITFLPIILMFLTSVFGAVRIRTMWMTTFYIFHGIFFVYLFKSNLNLKKLKSFFIIFLFLFFVLPIVYGVDSYFKENKRTDFPGKTTASKIQKAWNDNFSNEIEEVVGFGWVYGGWYAGNLSYHLKNRPIVKYQLKNNIDVGTVHVDALNNIKSCKGILLKIEPYYDSCLIGKK